MRIVLRGQAWTTESHPGTYVRLLLINYFEGIDSERGIAWRRADSLALRGFLGLGLDEAPPEHSTISRTRRLIDLETHRAVFTWILQGLATADPVKGKTIGIDATTLEGQRRLSCVACASSPELAVTPVIFYTATYHEREARALAFRCGATDVLTKPSAPNLILATIDAALDSSLHAPSPPLDRPELDREPLHLVGSALAVRTDRLEAEKERMAAVLQVATELVGDRDPFTMLNTLCSRTRHLTLAQHAVIGLLGPDGTPRETLCTSGVDETVESALRPPSADSALLSVVVGARPPVRTRNPCGRPEALGLPIDHPTVSSLLSVPIASWDQVYGWLSLRNKLVWTHSTMLTNAWPCRLESMQESRTRTRSCAMTQIIVSRRLNESSMRRPPTSERTNESSSPERSTTGWDKRWRA